MNVAGVVLHVSNMVVGAITIACMHVTPFVFGGCGGVRSICADAVVPPFSHKREDPPLSPALMTVQFLTLMGQAMVSVGMTWVAAKGVSSHTRCVLVMLTPS